MRRLLFLLLLTTTIAAAQQPVSLLRARLKTASDTDKAKTYIAISKFFEEGQPDSAVDYCNRGIRLAEKRNDRHDQALLLLQMGRINAIHHHAELSRRFDNEALSIFRSLRDQEGIAAAYDELGLLDGQQQNIKSATLDMNQAMKYFQDAHDSTGIIETYHGLGAAYEEKGETEKALTYYLRALVQYEHRRQKPAAYFLLLEKIGRLYLLKGDSHTALRYLEEGVHNSNTSQFRDTQITLLDEEGKIYETAGEKVSALDHYKLALADAKKFNRPEEEAEALINIAGVLKKADTAQSLGDLKKALHIADSLRQPQLQASIFAAMVNVYRQEKDYKEAMIALEEQHRLLDSLLEADTTKEIAELDSSYALETSRERIGSLQQVNREEKTALDLGVVILAGVVAALILLWLYLRKMRRLNLALNASNKVRDTLFSIIGHDLKGPVGSAAQLVALMEDEDFTEAELRGMIPEIRRQTKVSYELLDALFEWGKAQLQGVKVSPDVFSTKPFITKNISLLVQQASIKQIAVYDHTPANVRVFADPNHFDFVVRNLLSNAIKFTFKAGRIDIDATLSDNSAEMIFSVKDTGKGISAEQQQAFLKTNLTVSFGTGGEKGSGLGLLLIREFIQANNGRIWLESEEEEGSTFYFSFPAEKGR